MYYKLKKEEKMSINLTKGQCLEIDIKKLTLGLGWDPVSGTDIQADLDCSVFLLNESKLLPNEENFIFYNNLKSPCGSVQHSGDDTTGTNSLKGDDEQIKIDINKIPDDIVEMVFVVSIHSPHNFGSVSNSYIRIINNETQIEMAKFILDETFSIEKSIEFGKLYKIDGKWKFNASGVGYSEDLSYFVEKYYSGNIVK